jgi:hypothetical protein
MNNPATRAMRRWLRKEEDRRHEALNRRQKNEPTPDHMKEDSMTFYSAPYYSAGAKALRIERARAVAVRKPFSNRAKARVARALARPTRKPGTARPGFPYKPVTRSEDGEPSYVE